ncbi:MAG: thioredoxin family protein [Sulfurimonas sp.]|nr:thioredoxin family protein [Sulfurimonas sp.]
MRFLFLISTLLAVALNASHISWYGNFDKAHQAAIKENKKLMVLLIKKDCKPCQYSIKTTFLNQPYIKDINDNYISVIVTKNQKESYPIEMLYTFEYPTLFFLDNRELFVCEPLIREVTPERLKNHLKLCR